MNRILILCDNFPPQSGPRMGYLCKYLKPLGWNAYVVAAENKSRNDLTGLSGYAEEVHVIPQRPHRKWNLLHMLPFFWPYDYLKSEYEMRRVAMEIAERKNVDLVLCSHTYGWFPLGAAQFVARKTHLPLVVDIRDLPEQNPLTTFWQKSSSQKMDALRSALSLVSRQRACRWHGRAACLTTISPWHAQWLRRWNPQTHCIYNGFDPELFRPAVPRPNARFEILYTGTLATKRMRDPDLLLKAVGRMRDRGEIDRKTFRVVFYGEPTGSHVKASADELGVSEFLEYHDYVPISDVPALYAKASCLLLLAASPAGGGGSHGVMTTKFFEYLASGRPILCVPSDGECLADTMHKTKGGCAARTVDEVETYVLRLYREWRVQGVVRGTTDPNALGLFSRKGQAAQFAAVFERVVRGCHGEGVQDFGRVRTKIRSLIGRVLGIG